MLYLRWCPVSVLSGGYTLAHSVVSILISHSGCYFQLLRRPPVACRNPVLQFSLSKLVGAYRIHTPCSYSLCRLCSLIFQSTLSTIPISSGLSLYMKITHVRNVIQLDIWSADRPPPTRFQAIYPSAHGKLGLNNTEYSYSLHHILLYLFPAVISHCGHYLFLSWGILSAPLPFLLLFFFVYRPQKQRTWTTCGRSAQPVCWEKLAEVLKVADCQQSFTTNCVAPGRPTDVTALWEQHSSLATPSGVKRLWK